MYFSYPPYVSVAERRETAKKKIATLRKSGSKIKPVQIEGRKISKTFWGNSWCKNLEAYSDYSNRLPRGRSYVCNGSVVDLQIERGVVRAMVSGSQLYQVNISIAPIKKTRWKTIKGQCTGKIDSLMELLQGSVSQGVMQVVTKQGEGLFPFPKEIAISCSCPDWASMCKHVAATLYGVGARLDEEPEMLFLLRGVEPLELISQALDVSITKKNSRRRVLGTDDAAAVFGFDLNEGSPRAKKKTANGRKKGTKKSEAKTAAVPKKSATKTLKKTVKKSATKALKKTVKKSATKTLKKTVKKKAVKKSAAKTSKKSAAKTLKKTVKKKAVKKAVKKSAKKSKTKRTASRS